MSTTGWRKTAPFWVGQRISNTNAARGVVISVQAKDTADPPVAARQLVVESSSNSPSPTSPPKTGRVRPVRTCRELVERWASIGARVEGKDGPESTGRGSRHGTTSGSVDDRHTIGGDRPTRSGNGNHGRPDRRNSARPVGGSDAVHRVDSPRAGQPPRRRKSGLHRHSRRPASTRPSRRPSRRRSAGRLPLQCGAAAGGLRPARGSGSDLPGPDRTHPWGRAGAPSDHRGNSSTAGTSPRPPADEPSSRTMSPSRNWPSAAEC